MIIFYEVGLEMREQQSFNCKASEITETFLLCTGTNTTSFLKIIFSLQQRLKHS